jgi:hypothetical protein
MKPRLIVHIGTLKTGTTSLQHSMFDVRGRLREDHGVHFAGTDRAASPRKHTSVSRASRSSNEAKRDVEYEALLKDFERSGAHTMIVSEEQMSYPRESVPAFFQRFIPRFDVDVVCYLRRQDIFMESLYNQAMRVQKYFGLPHLSHFWRDERFFHHMDYHRILTWWKDIGANVVAVDFKKDVKSLGLLPSFLRAARLEVGKVPEKKANESTDMRLLLTLRMISAAQPEDEHSNLMAGMHRAAATLQDRGLFKPMKSTLGSRERQEIIKTCQESNERLARDFGVRFDDEMPDEQPRTILRPEPGYVLALLGELSLTDGLEYLRQCRRRLRAGVQSTEAEESVNEIEVDTSASQTSDPAAIEALAEEFGVDLTRSGVASSPSPMPDPQTPRLMDLFGQLSTSDGLRLLERCRSQLLDDLSRIEPAVGKATKETKRASARSSKPKRSKRDAAATRHPA